MTFSWKAVLTLFVVAAVCIATDEARLRAAWRQEGRARMATLNATAARDSTHDVALENARVAQLAGDSLRVIEKRVVQVKQSRDALDEALRREKKATYALSAHVDALTAERTAASVTGVARSEATFHVRDEPYTVDADVALPPPPDSATLRLHIALDTLWMRLRVTCRDFTEAAVVVEAPRWARIALGAVSQDPGVCASRRDRPSGSHLRWRLRPVLGAGRVLTSARGDWGVFVGLGLTPGFDE